MANVTKAPFWQAKVATELDRNSHLSTLINDTCSKCHAPMANYEITQVQVYETIMGDAEGNITYTLLSGAQYRKDNRLTPKGFDKYSVPEDVAVKGAALDDADFNLGSDEVTYRIPVAAARRSQCQRVFKLSNHCARFFAGSLS